MFSRRLGFTKAATITLSNHNNHLFFRCTTFAGDSGSALILKDGCLVYTHQQTINALQERLQRAKLVKDRVDDRLEAADFKLGDVIPGDELSHDTRAVGMQSNATMYSNANACSQTCESSCSVMPSIA